MPTPVRILELIKKLLWPGARAKVTARIYPKRVYRVASDTWYDVDPDTGEVIE